MPLHICTHLKGQEKVGKQQVEAGGGGVGFIFPPHFHTTCSTGTGSGSQRCCQAPCAHWLSNPQ